MNIEKFISITCMSIFMLSVTNVHAQNGLENIIVEKYYVSDAADSIGNDAISASPGGLPAGSVTYRIYVDMLPGYKFQMAFGEADNPLTISTTTTFFNNEDRGSTTPSYSKNSAKYNTVMLDSWLSVGAACSGNMGILKSEDNGIATVVNADGLLQNADNSAGIPLTTQDGLIAGTPASATFVGFKEELSVFDAISGAGNLFNITDAGWASMNGSAGPTAANKVLIAQITTNGVLHFELNIQLATPTGSTEKYVAKDPVGPEILFSGLTY